MTVSVTPIGVGTTEGDDTGDKARVGGQSINSNQANFKAAIEELQGRNWTIRNTTLNPLVLGARYMANNHAGITFTMPATFAVSATDFSDIQIANTDDASNITLTPASGDAFFVDGATHGVDTTYAVTPGNLVILSPRTTNSEWDLLVVGGDGGAFSADAQTQITPSTSIVLDEATGDEIGLDLSMTVNKATSGNYTGLYMDVTETNAPGTSDNLIMAKVGGGNRFRVTNTGDLKVGSSSSGSTASILKHENAGEFRVSGGSATTSGSQIRLFGGTHGSQANDIELTAGNTVNMHYDNSARSSVGHFDFKTHPLTWAYTSEDAPFFNFVATADGDTTSAISTHTTSATPTHHIQVEINGTKAWIPCSTTAPTA